jgi:hypothetical protein
LFDDAVNKRIVRGIKKIMNFSGKSEKCEEINLLYDAARGLRSPDLQISQALNAQRIHQAYESGALTS